MISLFKYLVLSFLFAMLLHGNAFSQKFDIQNIESITIATDRSLYIAGEPIWFNAKYTIPNDTSLILSKVLYVELFNNDNQLVASQKLSITKGVISGQMMIPENAVSGYYILRAYTRYQENFPPWQFTSLILSVVNPSNPLPTNTYNIPEKQITVATMPDGYLAFNIDEPILSKIDTIELFVDGKQVHARNIFYSNGLGRFNYKVKQGEKVHLLVNLKTGDTIRSRTFSPSSFPLELVANTKLDKLELNLINIVHPDNELLVSVENLTGRQSITNSTPLNNNCGSTYFSLSEIGSGLLVIKISTSDGAQIFESYHYVEQKSIPLLDAITDSLVLPDDPINIDLSDLDNNHFPIAVSMVMKGTHSTDLSLLPKYLINNPLYIESFLTSNLQFGNCISDQIAISIALKRQELIRLLDKKEPELEFIVPELYGLTVQGKLVSPSNQEPLQDELVYCSVLGDQHQFHATRSSKDGSFIIPLNYLNSSQDLYIGTGNSEEPVSEITINSGFCPTPPLWNPSPFELDKSSEDLLTQMYFNYQVVNAFNIVNLGVRDCTYHIQPVFGNNLTQIKLSDYIQLSSTPEVFNEIVPNIRVRERNNQFEFVIFDDDINIKYTNPLVIVDQIPYIDIDKIMELQATQIEQIDFTNHAYVYGNNIFSGIVIIKTNTGNFAGLPLPGSGVFVEYESFQPNKQFIPFSSGYKSSEKPNYANTVFWRSYSKDNKPNNLSITAPNGIADYELLVLSLANAGKIIGRQKISVKKAQLVN